MKVKTEYLWWRLAVGQILTCVVYSPVGVTGQGGVRLFGIEIPLSRTPKTTHHSSIHLISRTVE